MCGDAIEDLCGCANDGVEVEKWPVMVCGVVWGSMGWGEYVGVECEKEGRYQ